MKTRKNLAVLASRMLTAIAMVCGMVMFASCDKDLNTDSGLDYSSRYMANPDTPKGWESFINDSTKRDSVLLPDGTFDRVLLKVKVTALPHREVIVENFDNPNAGESFSSNRRMIDSRREGNWMITAYSTDPHKGVEVGSTGETVAYTTYEEVATYIGEDFSYEFASEGFEVENVSDEFKKAPLSSKDGYTELDYKNQIKATYTGYKTTKVFNKEETIAFFAKGDQPIPDPVKVDHYEVIGANRVDYPTYTYVTLEKIAVYTDGTRESAGKFSANLPINVSPLTNWVLNVDNLGTYVANSFSGTQTGMTARTAEKFFSYNNYTYRYANTVAGKENALSVSVPNDIVFDDGDVKYSFNNTSLSVNKGAENTSLRSEDDSKKTYGYTCIANVIFGASQAVTLPGTINVKKATVPETNHDHGKVREVIFTTTQNENCSFYKSVCVIVFEDGYHSVGMAENDSKTFTFNMSSTTNGVNSAVYADGKWQVSKAEDNTSAKCMIWRNEAGQAKRTLDFVTATAQRWNNGHNTIKDPRRSYTIIDGGYGVTLSLNGSAGQTLHF